MNRLEAVEHAARFILGEEATTNAPLVMKRIEQSMIQVTLERVAGDKARAARILGMKRTTLIEKLRRWEKKP